MRYLQSKAARPPHAPRFSHLDPRPSPPTPHPSRPTRVGRDESSVDQSGVSYMYTLAGE